MRVLLLHVINLNIVASDSRIYEELGQEAFWHLRRLSEYLHPRISRRLRVRMGRVAEEIIAEAKDEGPEFVVLTTRQSGATTRSGCFWRSRADRRVQSTGLRLVAQTDCNVVILPAQSSFDCESVWGRPTTSDNQHLSPEDWRADSLISIRRDCRLS